MALEFNETPPICVAIGLIWLGHSLVVGTRPAGSPCAGDDEFPGGKAWPGEALTQTVERECFEETGLRVHAQTLRLVRLHSYPHGSVRLHFFDCIPTAALDLKPPFRWVEIQQIFGLRFPAGNSDLLEHLREFPFPKSPVKTPNV